MLDLIRKKQKSFILKFVFWAIIATFVGTIFLVWGKGRNQGRQESNVVATVNDTKIGYEEFQSAYSNLYRLYQNVYQEKFTPDLEKQLRLKQQALDSLIDQVLLLQEGRKMGLDVSEKELVDSIAQVPAFRENGAFSKDRYLQVLSYQRMTPDIFEAMQERQILIQKVQKQLQGTVTVSAEEIKEEFRKLNEKVNLAFVRLAPALYESRVKVTEPALEEYFAEHREEFRIPDTVALRYLQFDPARYEKEVVFEEGELEKYYRRHLELFEIEEQVKASHILIRVPEDAPEKTVAKKRDLADEILKKARAGEDFTKLARTYSDDAGSAAQGGELGYFSRGAMVAPFEQAAFALQPGEISDIVKTPFGFHIIKSEAYVEAGVKPLADVIDQVKAGLRTEKAKKMAYEKALDTYNINRKSGDLETAAKANDLGIKETGFFARGEAIDGIGTDPEISSSVFLLNKGELLKPVQRPEGIFLIQVKERRESRLPELKEVRNEVEQAYRADQGKVLARETAEAILTGLKEGKPLKSLAKKDGLPVEDTGLFARSYGAFIPRLGSAETLAEKAFSLTEKAPVADGVYEVDGKFVVAVLKRRVEADMAELDEAKLQELRESLLTRKKEEVLNNKLQALKEKADITISPAIKETL